MSQIRNALDERDAWRSRCEAARAQRDAKRLECKDLRYKWQKHRLRYKELMMALDSFMGCDCINDTCMEEDGTPKECIYLEPLVKVWQAAKQC